MRKGSLLTLYLILLFSILVVAPVAADQITENLESIVIESFDHPDNPDEAVLSSSEWIVRGSKFATKVYDENGKVVEQYPKSKYVEAWPEALFGRNKEGKLHKVLGVHGKFDRQGFNYIEFIPAVKGDDGELVPRRLEDRNEITIPGRAKTIDLWVWGANFDYYLEVHIRDFRGIMHVLPLGSIKYTGWKNLKVNIPTYIPQAGGYVTAGGYLKELKLVKLVLWTRPNEKVNDFLLYIDHMKVLTDMFVSRFDGDGLADLDFINDTWNTEGGN